jgi:hypothetical protein
MWMSHSLPKSKNRSVQEEEEEVDELEIQADIDADDIKPISEEKAEDL